MATIPPIVIGVIRLLVLVHGGRKKIVDVFYLPNVNRPAIRAGSLPVSQAANLPGYYEIPNKTETHY
jgi:hypothetical protein